MNFDHLNILLVCNLGYSTGTMVTKMREIADKSEKLKNIPIEIEARPAGEFNDLVQDFDVVLVGPQIRHQFSRLKKIADEYNKPIEVIDSEDYGTVNGANILKAAILLKTKTEKGE
ncbi:PTS sugar transporter subunit IIB [Tetragenococcus halophilus]|uniref:PTS sugar transporter subunit IIB n=1 Tax=Tetragenococcus halophilus TaxID=51669 RepID=UPI0010319B7C